MVESLKWKLHANCPHRETEGKQLLKQLMIHYQGEFKWKRIEEILESATPYARAEAKKEYEKSLRTKETLRKLRHGFQ